MMINHTIDLSVFAIPKNLFLTADEVERRSMVKNVLKAIDCYINIKKSQNSFCLLPLFNHIQSYNESMDILDINNAMKTIKSFSNYDLYYDTINELKTIVEYNHRKITKNPPPQYYTGNRKYKPNVPKSQLYLYSFKNRCCFQDIKVANFSIKNSSNSSSEIPATWPLVESLKKCLSAIEIMNQEVYTGRDRHFVVTRLCEGRDAVEFNTELKELDWGPRGKSFPWMEKIRNQNLFQQIKGTVRIKSPEKCEIFKTKLNTLREAVEQAKKDFGNDDKCLRFQTKVDESVTSLDERLDLPDRIYHYLETLNEITKIKNANPEFPLQFLGWMHGLDYADDESYDTKKCPLATNQRKLNDDDPDDIFWAHLRPHPTKIRIHFKWDANEKITRVGWVGKHLITYESIEEGRVNAADCPANCTNFDCKLKYANQIQFSK